MKKLLLSGFTAVALMAAGTVQASDLGLYGDTGLVRTPLAMSAPPMSFAIAADYVSSEELFVPIRAEIGLPFGFEIGGNYNYLDLEADVTMWGVNAKWTLPEFVKGLGLAVGGHYNTLEIESFSDNSYDVFGAVSYSADLGSGMALIPTFGGQWFSRDNDGESVDAFKFFGSLLFKMPKFAVGAEYTSVVEEYDGVDVEGSYWVGGRFYVNPMITLQAGYMNNANFSNEIDVQADGVFNVGLQIALGGGK